MAGNTDLNKASKAKKDEFYTQMPDIEAEMRHYKDQFRDKVIFCNYDDPYESNFFKKDNRVKNNKLIDFGKLRVIIKQLL